MKHITCILLALGLLSACGDKEETYQERPVEDLYQEAKKAFDKKDYETAAKGFDEVERQHPYSGYATKSQLMAAHAYYLGGKYPEAVSELDSFIQLHPTHKDIDYAYYLKGLCHYTQIPTIEIDQSPTDTSVNAFQELLTRFPDSQYAKAARIKLDLANDHLAGREMAVGRFYLFKRMYIPAAVRFNKVVKDYQKTNYTPEALHRLVECYVALGIPEEAQAIAAVLGHNFPGSQWYKDSYRLLKENHQSPDVAKDSWLARTWKRIVY